MRNMHNLVKYCVPLTGCSISRLFHDIASPNLVGRYYMTQKVTSTNGCYENYVTVATEQVTNISQYKAAAVSYLIIDISDILSPTKLDFGMKMRLHPTVNSVSGC